MRGFTFLIFVFLTICCWGVYGPVLHEGQAKLGGGGELSRWKPMIFVGLAYFVIAVVYPTIVLYTKGEQGKWSPGGFFWSFVAGAIGAIGALGIILAFNFGGKPVFVMPLVFGCAPVVNTLVTMLMSRSMKEASLFFYIGILVVAIGGAGVMLFKPAEAKHAKVEKQADDQEKKVADDDSSSEKKSSSNVLLMIGSIAMTALCWGAYGPVLHKGQAKMEGSKLRPFLCVGLAYFVIGVLVPLPLLGDDPGSWDSLSGCFWSLAAGTVGAFGALGIIYAFNFGGKPIFVMPLVFGCAPVMNTLSTTLTKGLWDSIEYRFLISMCLVIFGAVTVLITAPRKAPPKKSTDEKKNGAVARSPEEPEESKEGKAESQSNGAPKDSETHQQEKTVEESSDS